MILNTSVRSRISLNGGWRFLVVPEGNTSPESACEADFDDSGWRTVNLPHDWAIEGPFDIKLDGATGKLPWRRQGWYRKTFTLPATDSGKRIFLDIDGAMANSTIYLNGKKAGGRPYGYMPFRTELTELLNFGGENVLAVHLNTAKWGSRWYPGAGIYRNVWLVKTHPVSIGRWGVHIQTPEISDREGTVTLDVTLENRSDEPVSVRVQSMVYEYGPDAQPGKVVGKSASCTLSIPPEGSKVAAQKVAVPSPKRWELTDPQRYLSVTEVFVQDRLVDTFLQPFGFRTLDFTANEGFRLNGQRVAVQGVCMHHDLGPLGTAFNTRAFERQMEIMKEMGVNALRTSHNPPAPEVLEICDRMGILVQVETFDCWRWSKTPNDYSAWFDEWHERDLGDIMRMARNHPSVFMWCLGNEVNELESPEGIEIVQRLKSIARRYDTSCPVTVGSNRPQASINGFQKHVDVFGFNYFPAYYDVFQRHEENRGRPFVGTETASCISSRGEYFFPVFDDFRGRPSGGYPGRSACGSDDVDEKISRGTGGDFQMSSYDVGAPGWAATPDYEFMMLDKNPAAHGEFVWTGFDYIGEPTPYNDDMTNLLNFSDPEKQAEMKAEMNRLGNVNVPSRSSYFGIVDLCGFRKDRFYMYQARWRPEWPMAHLLPHWNWPERVGKVTPVHLYTSGDEAELFVNGTSLGRKKKGEFEYRLRWNDVCYQPGELKAVAYKNGKKWAEDIVKTAGNAARLSMSADRVRIAADGYDLSFITVRVTDQDGTLVPRTHNTVKYTLEGPGEIVAVGNGNPNSHESFQSTERRVFNGLALVVVRSVKGRCGTVRIRAAAQGLECAAITLRSGMGVETSEKNEK